MQAVTGAMSQAVIQDLPCELVMAIAEYCGAKSTIMLATTCKQYVYLLDDSELWTNFIRVDHGVRSVSVAAAVLSVSSIRVRRVCHRVVYMKLVKFREAPSISFSYNKTYIYYIEKLAIILVHFISNPVFVALTLQNFIEKFSYPALEIFMRHFKSNLVSVINQSPAKFDALADIRDNMRNVSQSTLLTLYYTYVEVIAKLYANETSGRKRLRGRIPARLISLRDRIQGRTPQDIMFLEIVESYINGEHD